MRTIFLTVMMCILFSSISAQIKFGVSAGTNFSNIKTTDEGEHKPIIGITGGVNIKLGIGKHFAFQPELNFIQKGYQYKEEGSDQGLSFKAKGKQLINYLELPLNFSYRLPLAKKNIFVSAGPAVAFALSGFHKAATEFMGENISIKEQLEFGSSGNDMLKKYDIGANISVEIEVIKSLFARINYTHGLQTLYNGYVYESCGQNCTRSTGRNAEYFNRSAGLSVAYYFGK